MSPPKHCLLSALPEHYRACTSACRLRLPPWAAVRDSGLSLPIALEQNPWDARRLTCQTASRPTSESLPCSISTRMQGCRSRGWWGSRRGMELLGRAEAQGMHSPLGWCTSSWRRQSPCVHAAKAVFLAPNLVLGCEWLSTTHGHRSTQLAVLTQAPGRTASILGEY